MKLNGWLVEIDIKNCVREEGPTVDAEGEDEKGGDRDNGKPCLQLGVPMPMDRCQSLLPRQMPLLDGCIQPPMPDVSRGMEMPLVERTAAMTTQQQPFNSLRSPQCSPSEQGLVHTQPAIFSISAGPLSASDGNNAYDHESEVSTRTVPDEELLLDVASVSRLAHFDGLWFADVGFQESLLPQQYFGQLCLANSRLSGLVTTAQFAQGYCRVQWRSDTMPVFDSRLPSCYADLVQRLNTVCSTQDGVEWHAHDSTYTVPGSNERHHLCLGGRCQSCASLTSSVAPAFSSRNWGG